MTPRNALRLGDRFKFAYDDSSAYEVVAVYPRKGGTYYKLPTGRWGRLALGPDVWMVAA